MFNGAFFMQFYAIQNFIQKKQFKKQFEVFYKELWQE
jgi:hypothetical protein